MEVLKRKILLEDSIDRSYNSPMWGSITADTFYINVFITQNIDDMGLFTDVEFISADTFNQTVDYSILVDKLSLSDYSFPFMSGVQVQSISGYSSTDLITLRFTSDTESSFYNYGGLSITGNTDSKIEDVRSYDILEPYKIGFDVGRETYEDYEGVTISGVSRVVTLGEPSTYVIDTKNDSDIGTQNQVFGLLYNDFSGMSRNVVIDGIKSRVPITTVKYKGQGWNETNTSLSGITKEEYLFGIISPPEVKSDVFIDRSVTSIMEMHLKLSEIKDLGELARYGNGFYNLTK